MGLVLRRRRKERNEMIKYLALIVSALPVLLISTFSIFTAIHECDEKAWKVFMFMAGIVGYLAVIIVAISVLLMK